MAQTFTLDDAASHLNLSVEEFKRRLRDEWKHVRSFRDGPTLRFRAGDIEELGRTIGLGSSEELPLANPGESIDDSNILQTPPKPIKVAGPNSGNGKSSLDSDSVILMEGSGERLVVKPGSDSDVRLEASGKMKKPKPKAEDDESILTDEFELPSEGGSGKLTGKSGKLSSAKLKGGDSGKLKGAKVPVPPEDDSSEFELSLDVDSDEFELSLTDDSSEEVSFNLPKSKNKGEASGINLNRPKDSGISLEQSGRMKKPDSDAEIDFELSLDSPSSSSHSASSRNLGSGKKLKSDSDSEFELTLEEPSDLSLELNSSVGEDKKGDIFEATDFEIPALDDDSASEAVALDDGDTDLESSDFDIALDDADATSDDDSASQVVALDDEDEAPRRSKKKGKKAAAADLDLGDVDDLDDDEGGASASRALRGVRHEEDDEDEEGTISPAATPAQWGVVPIIMLVPTMIVLLIGGLMAYELLHTVWGYQQASRPSTPLVNWVADLAGMKPAQ